MSTYTDRAFAALAQFSGRLTTLVEQVQQAPAAPPRLTRGTLDELLKIAGRARIAADAIMQSFTLIEQTSLDVVDMQVRLQGETARLASALRALGDLVEKHAAVGDAFGPALVALDEAAQMVSTAVFPSAVQGLRDVNVTLWDFQKIQWKRYTDLLTAAVQRGTLTLDQQTRIQEIADGVFDAFAEVNALLNDLAERRAFDAAALRERLREAPARLTAALTRATEEVRRAPEGFERFVPVIEDSKDVADDVARRLRKVTIPIFPNHEALGTCCAFVPPALYESLSGIQTFALLNILARCQATHASGRPLLENRRVEVKQVFPDRIYFEADRSMIDDIANDAATFQAAPASLHKFNEGSFKQTTFTKGNLQVSYATRPGNRVMVDADIDLYRLVVPHLFGEVLVNHLTGTTTDQYAVRAILDGQQVASIGSFALLQV